MQRPARSDALASSSRIVEAARRVFASGDGSGSLDHIAHEAGVGVATLYRHFSNRQALAMAVFDQIFSVEVEPLLERLGDSDAPRAMMLEIAERVADVVDRERGLADSLGNLTEASAKFLRPRAAAFGPMVEAAQRAGNLRPDLTPDDVAVIIAVMISSLPTIAHSAATRRRYLSLLLDALNPGAAESLPALEQ